MKIAVISTPWIAVPPVGYGGIERVVYNIVEGMVKRGHDVTLFAPGDSQTSAKLSYFYQKAVGNNLYFKFNPYHMLAHLHHAFSTVKKGAFDIVHNHAGRLSLFFADFIDTPMVYTLHGSYQKELEQTQDYNITHMANETLRRFGHKPFVSISNKQREGAPELNYMKTIYNSIILSEFNFSPIGGADMLWFGRVAATKGLDTAIHITHAEQKNLAAATFLDPGEREYFEKNIQVLLEGNPYVKVLSEIKDIKMRSDFLGGGRVFLFPIRWDEPFGIVMIEAMATGTPVVAFAKGSVPEVVVDGVTGFIVNYSDEDTRGDWIIKKTGEEGLREAVHKIYSMDEKDYTAMRRACRAHVEEHFTVEKMVDAYEEVYKKVLCSR